MKVIDVPMAERLQLRFDYEALDAETRAFVSERVERIHNLARMTAAGIVQIGQYLSEVKARLKHGQFLEWIEREFAWGDDSARNFVRVFEMFKNRNFRDLEIDVSALYLIAAPSTPEPVRAEALRRAENGEPVNHAGARTLVQQFAETGEIPDIQVSLPQMIAERRRQISPPPPVAHRTAEERREEELLRREMEANSAKVAAMMGVIRSIETVAHASFSAAEIACDITRFDTPDVDWRGAVREAAVRLEQLRLELKL